MLHLILDIITSFIFLFLYVGTALYLKSRTKTLMFFRHQRVVVNLLVILMIAIIIVNHFLAIGGVVLIPSTTTFTFFVKQIVYDILPISILLLPYQSNPYILTFDNKTRTKIVFERFNFRRNMEISPLLYSYQFPITSENSVADYIYIDVYFVDGYFHALTYIKDTSESTTSASVAIACYSKKASLDILKNMEFSSYNNVDSYNLKETIEAEVFKLDTWINEVVVSKVIASKELKQVFYLLEKGDTNVN
ncbi:hypothetical protein GPZ88_09895 (plasmid) [Streptococcus ruminicola]|uniref:Uncharacterized protein n=1 Tax=Streptococcus ruminicola TaxID=2686210 RepID=A0A6G8I2P4_9STRE|nr:MULTISPECIES: hypothetical protein [Streptococcus]QGX47407.1 hypothetical protein GPA00_09350 [Streptococcus equinus]QIM47380.1 hypothetical protein GPZ88_09895 [Streptococcus ruminicola]